MGKQRQEEAYEEQTKNEITEIKRRYPPEKVQELLRAGMTEERAAESLGLDLMRFKILLCLYRCTGDLHE